MSDDGIRTYYDRPILKEPAWTWEVPWYLFVGGLSGMSSVVARVADAAGDTGLATVARRAAAVGAVASPALLIADLGRPARFYNMMRVLRPTSPMSVGSWVLAFYGPAAVGGALLETWGRLPRVAAMADRSAAALGPPLAAYTAVLLSNTAIPVWSEARRELPLLFVSSGVAASGAVGSLVTASPASRRLMVGGVAVERAVSAVMERRLGVLAKPYHEGRAGRFSKASKVLSVGGALAALLPGRRFRRIGAVLALVAGVCERYAVFDAGFASANDPRATIRSQRDRHRRQPSPTPAAAAGVGSGS